MEDEGLITIASNLYYALTGQKPDDATAGRIRSGVEAALGIKKVDENLFYGLVVVGLVQAKTRFDLSNDACHYVDRLARYYAEKSECMQRPEE